MTQPHPLMATYNALNYADAYQTPQRLAKITIAITVATMYLYP
ncbi:hypothetical protein ABDI32_01955 [Bacillus wiedmannii]